MGITFCTSVKDRKFANKVRRARIIEEVKEKVFFPEIVESIVDHPRFRIIYESPLKFTKG